MRVIAVIVRIPFVGFHRKLIDLRTANRSHQMAYVKIMPNKVLFQVFNQLGNACRVACTDIIDRFNESFTQQIAPHSVDVAAGEIRVLWTGKPSSKLLAPRRICHDRVLGLERKLRCNNLLRLLMFHFSGASIGHFFVQRFCAFDSRATDGLVARFIVLFQRDLRKERGSLVVLILGPSFKWMVMAFVAVEPNSEKQVGGVFKGIFWGSQDFVVRSGWVFAIGAGCSNDLVHELVIGLIASHTLADPFSEFCSPFFAQELRIDLQ